MLSVSRPRVFGAAAERYAPFLGDLPIAVVSDRLVAAWDELLAARRSGEQFAVMPLLEDPRARLAFSAANDVCVQIGQYDQRRLYLEGIERGDLPIEGKTILEWSVHDPELVAQMRQITRLGGTVVARSFAELRRLRAAFGAMRSNVTRWFPSRRIEIPARGSEPRHGTIVVWAPDDGAEHTALAAVGLEQLHGEVVVVAHGAPRFATRFAYVEPADAAVGEILARAGCVVDLSLGDPSWAYAFSAAGFPVAAASTSGADEIAEGIAIYDPWSFRSIANAVAEARGRGPGTVCEPPPEPEKVARSLRLSVPEMPSAEPLVSIVIPTYNRRAMLETTLRELVNQWYRNIEIVVVNDGGVSVRDLAFDPRIRVLEREINVGVAGAANAGIAAAKGEYVEIAADDDRIYPDHVLRLVAALERTGAAVAHSNTLIVAVVAVDARGVETLNYNTERFYHTVDLTEAYAFHRIARSLVRRSVYEELGGFDEKLFLSDLELQIRLAEHYDFVHVPHITAEHWMRGGDQLSTRPDIDLGAALKEMFDRHPAPGRPYVAALRSQVLERFGGAKTP